MIFLVGCIVDLMVVNEDVFLIEKDSFPYDGDNRVFHKTDVSYES